MRLRRLAVLLAVTLPLIAQTSVRVDAIVTDPQGNRIRGLTAADFRVLEGEEERTVDDVVEYSARAAAVEVIDDPRFVPLVTLPAPAPPAHVAILGGDLEQAASVAARLRPSDVTTIDVGPESALPQRIAAAAIRLGRHPGRKGIVIFAEPGERAITFAARRGVAVVRPEALDDLTSYYAVTFRTTGGRTVQLRTTRALNVRSVIASAPALADDANGESVLAHHFVAPASNELRISATATPPVASGAKRQVKVHVLVPVASLTLTREGDLLTGGFDVLSSIGDGKSRFTRVNRQSHAIRWPVNAGAEPSYRNIDFTFDVVLEPGSSQVSIGVVDHRSQKTGFHRVEVP